MVFKTTSISGRTRDASTSNDIHIGSSHIQWNDISHYYNDIVYVLLPGFCTKVVFALFTS